MSSIGEFHSESKEKQLHSMFQWKPMPIADLIVALGDTSSPPQVYYACIVVAYLASKIKT